MPHEESEVGAFQVFNKWATTGLNLLPTDRRPGRHTGPHMGNVWPHYVY